jgi:tRNA (cmo5U34)-methyltransferase
MSTPSIKEHFESEAAEFDNTIIKLIPYYEQMLTAIVDSVEQDFSAKFRVLDLGCGTGTLAKKMIERFPNAEITCLDISPKMIELATYKLDNLPNIKFLVGDFSKTTFETSFDLVVSSLAIHHIQTDLEKKDFYKTIYTTLAPEGQFINGDVVLATSLFHRTINIYKWVEYMNRSVSMDEIQNKWLVAHKNEDRPSILMDQLKWLEEIGYRNLDVYWKYYNFCVFGAKKVINA